MGGGDDTLNIQSGSVITGTVDGGTGTDLIRLGFPGINTGGTFAGSVNFESLQVVTGAWNLTGSQSYANGIRVLSGTTISGSAATLAQSRIVVDGLVIINENSNTSYTGTITGSGSVTKGGAGNLSLGTQSFTGGLGVTGGTLTLTGQLAVFGYSVGTGATLTSSLATTVPGATSTGFVGTSVTNSGTLRNTNAGGRAVDLTGNASITLNISNQVGALIESANDAIRINGNPTGVNVRISNSGTIRSTNGGQAIDFDAVARGGSIEIINTATGIIQSVGQDAIRPGQGAIVTNAGLIFSDGPANNSFDGLDWQARSGRVVNQTGGTVSGLRHGITSDVNVDVNNSGTILGRNGSGIGSDGTGIVVNFGTITGQWDGIATNGDGDGVDIDFIGTVRNFGTIRGLTAAGVDSGGRPNSAQGVAMGGGTIENAAGAMILGGAQGVLINHDTNPGGVADGPTTITNAGTIRGNTGEGILLVGTFNDVITTSGLIAGNGVALDMGAGNDTLNVFTGASFVGSVNGGAGTDLATLGGTGGSFGATTGFEALAVNAGNWTLTAPSTYANGITLARVATLTGDAMTLVGAIANAGTLIYDQRVDGTAAVTLTGAGQLTKTGNGALTIGSQPGFNGVTVVNAGRLILAGSLPSAVTVANGATLGGTGAIASLSIAPGGTVAPGNSPGTITVTGAFAQAAGSTYAAEITAAGLSDRIDVGGIATIGSGAVLTVSRDTGNYAVGTRYVLLTAGGGITGTYALVQTPGGGTELRFVQTGNAIAVDVARTAASLSTLARTENQAAVASAFGAFSVANPAYAALTLIPDDATARAALDDLSGDIHATARTSMLRSAQSGEDAARSRLFDPAIGSRIWMQSIGQSGNDDGGRGASPARRSGWGLFGGIDLMLADTRVGIAGGYTHADVTLGSRSGAAEVETRQVLGYAGGKLGPFALRTAVGYAWTSTDVSRSIRFPGFAAVARSDYNGEVLHGFVEVGIPMSVLGGTVEPFGGIELYRVGSDGFTESSSAVALTGRAVTETFAMSTVGFRAETPITEGLMARTRVGWQHVLGDPYPQSVLRFSSGGQAFVVAGVPLSDDAAALSLDLAWQPSQRLTILSGFSGVIGGVNDDSRFRIAASFAF